MDRNYKFASFGSIVKKKAIIFVFKHLQIILKVSYKIGKSQVHMSAVGIKSLAHLINDE